MLLRQKRHWQWEAGTLWGFEKEEQPQKRWWIRRKKANLESSTLCIFFNNDSVVLVSSSCVSELPSMIYIFASIFQTRWKVKSDPKESGFFPGLHIRSVCVVYTVAQEDSPWDRHQSSSRMQSPLHHIFFLHNSCIVPISKNVFCYFPSFNHESPISLLLLSLNHLSFPAQNENLPVFSPFTFSSSLFFILFLYQKKIFYQKNLRAYIDMRHEIPSNSDMKTIKNEIAQMLTQSITAATHTQVRLL